jgi:hypothetical protein
MVGGTSYTFCSMPEFADSMITWHDCQLLMCMKGKKAEKEVWKRRGWHASSRRGAAPRSAEAEKDGTDMLMRRQENMPSDNNSGQDPMHSAHSYSDGDEDDQPQPIIHASGSRRRCPAARGGQRGARGGARLLSNWQSRPENLTGRSKTERRRDHSGRGRDRHPVPTVSGPSQAPATAQAAATMGDLSRPTEHIIRTESPPAQQPLSDSLSGLGPAVQQRQVPMLRNMR